MVYSTAADGLLCWSHHFSLMIPMTVCSELLTTLQILEKALGECRYLHQGKAIHHFHFASGSLMPPLTQWKQKFQSDPESRIPAGSRPELNHL